MQICVIEGWKRGRGMEEWKVEEGRVEEGGRGMVCSTNKDECATAIININCNPLIIQWNRRFRVSARCYLDLLTEFQQVLLLVGT